MPYDRIKPALLCGLVALGSVAAIHSDELLDGVDARTLAMTCTSCHGSDGLSAGPAVPSIGGMNPGYFVKIMEGFRSGEIYSVTMGRIAKGYSDAEIERLADYFHDRPFVPAKQDFDPELAAQGRELHDHYCERCHSEGGIALEGEEYHILAGQWVTYLRNAMEDFRTGRRPLDKKMKRKLDRLLEREGETSLDALLAFYASQQ
ncbi:cytochrome c553 [Thioflavicoccus mobilis 8321]|uniref:Cytochrome c553 n=1 Tax=Thioflavicoccus mobilis 8321 TaxID=765912 RepID=L0GYT5_9GAMM|nr:c-type cytochrome [Thioflavicoccus mobilis]AGA90982.1 cytochrome c553 [Thioflavicoccus mobilis 8321]